VPNDVNFLAGGGEIGALMRAHDWATSPLGPPAAWPQSLRSVVGLLIGSKFPMFVAWGRELGFLYNDSYAEILGAKHPAALGARFYDIWSEIWPDISPLIDAAMAGEATFRDDLPLVMNRRGFDEQTWFTFSYSPVRDESGRVAGMFCAVQETTDRVLAARQQAEETERQRRMFEQAPGFICTLRGPEHVFDFVNDTYKRLFGDRGFIGKPVRRAFPELAGQGFYDLLDKVYTTGVRHVAHAAPMRLRATPEAPEEERFLDFIYAPLTDAAGRVVGIFCEGQDVTEAHRAQEALRELNETLERRVAEALAERKVLADIVEGTDAFVQVADLDFRWLAINKAAADEFARIFGVRPRVGASMLDLLADQPEHRSAVQAVWSRALAGEEFTEVAEFGDPGRDRRFYEMKYNSLRSPDGALIGAYQFVHDVTDRLRDEAWLRTIFETSHQLQGLLALDGTLLEANATSLAAIAAKAGDVIGKSFWDTPWFTGTAGMPEKVKQVLADVATNGRAYREEITVDLPTGRRSFDFSMRPMRDDRGEIVAVVPEAVETTDRRNAEEALRQAQKMEAVGQLTGGVAHDFNNLLTGVLGNLELLEARLDDSDDRARRLVQAAARSAQRGAKLTEQLLAFARKQHLAPEATDLNAAVRGMTEMLRRTLGGGAVGVENALAGDLWPALVDATQIEVALLNLAINARDAMPLGGTIRITTRNVAAGDERYRPPDLAPGDYVAIAVTDTGEGMAPEVLAKAFDPFFTTKEVGKGTGLGLSQVYGLARQSGGTARIRSKPGEGTTVEIYLPRAATLSERGGLDAEPAKEQGRRGTVLVVDDQDEIREVAVAQLEALGHRAVVAADGRLALDLLLVGSSPIDILLVDYAMPGMSGVEVVRAARKARPDAPIVLMTGYADARALGEPLPPGVVLLKKPFRMQELAAALEAAPRDVRRAVGGLNVIPLDRPSR
jgi:signal transduction histidine kinase/CheY-like chemotaxis protein